MTQDAIYEALSLLITLAIVVIVPLIRRYLLSRFSAQQLDNAQQVVWIAVRAVEQIAQAAGWNGPAKRAAALARARDLAKKIGLNLTDEQWTHLIEQAVLEMNRQWGKPPAA